MTQPGTSALRLNRALVLLLVGCGAALAQPQERTLELRDGATLRFRVLDPAEPGLPSARSVSERLLQHLAAGQIEEAALLSTAPRRRFEELAKYRLTVGEREFRQVFERYVAAGAPLVEVAAGGHRLLVWDLVEGPEQRLAGQYFVEIEGRFLLDDVPNETRSQLRQLLEAFRAGRVPVM